MTTLTEEEAGEHMTVKTRRKKARKRRSQPDFNPMTKTVNQGMQATVGLAALGITAVTVTKIAKP